MKKIYCLLMLLALLGCEKEPSDPLVFGAVTWPGYESIYVARELGYLDEKQVHLAEFTNTTEVLRAMRNNKLHVAGLTLDEALSLRRYIPDLQVFMVVDVSSGANVLMARQDIKNLGQLKGKRIGVEKTALGAYFLILILHAAHLSADEVHIISLPLDEQVKAYRTGLVDAVVTYGLRRAELSQAGAKPLFDSSNVPGKIVDVLVVRAADAIKHGEQINALAKAWFQALSIIQHDPARAYPLMARRESLPVTELENTLHGITLLDRRQSVQQLSGNPAPLFNTASEVQLILKQAGLDIGSDDLSHLINSRVLPLTRYPP